MKLIYGWVLVFVSTGVFAQMAVSADVIGGTPLSGQSYMDVKGSPYLSKDFEKGEVVTVLDKKYENMLLRYDLLAKKLIFKDNDGESKYFEAPIKSFTLHRADGPHYFERGVEGSFLEMIAKGRRPLWKATLKTTVDDRPYGSAKVEKIINTSTVYYAGELTSLEKIKTDKRSIMNLFEDKRTEVEGFIKDNKLNTKDDADLKRIFDFYNTL